MSVETILTIKDIAERAGVAKSTVSRVLNNSGYVSEKNRKIIEQIISESNYQPSATARSLSRKESNTIGVVIPEAAFYVEILRGISEIVDQNDLTMIFCNTENDQHKEQKALQMLNGQRVRGLILTPTADYNTPAEVKLFKKTLEQLKVPTILMDRHVENPQWDGVYYDNFNGAYLAAEALIKERHKRIGVITGNLKQIHGLDRFKGFKQALEDYNMTLEQKYVYPGNFTAETAYKITKEMIDSGDRPEALFLSNNLTAIGFLKAVFEKNLKLGRDICCIGFDYIDSLEIIDINYSYVERETMNMGRIAMQMLLERIEQPDLPRREHIIPARLILRGSEKKCQSV